MPKAPEISPFSPCYRNPLDHEFGIIRNVLRKSTSSNSLVLFKKIFLFLINYDYFPTILKAA